MHLSLEVCLHRYVVFLLVLSVVIFVLLLVLVPHHLLLVLDLVANVFSAFVGVALADAYSLAHLFVFALLALLLLLLRAEAISLQIDCNVAQDVAELHEADHLPPQKRIFSYWLRLCSGRQVLLYFLQLLGEEGVELLAALNERPEENS